MSSFLGISENSPDYRYPPSKNPYWTKLQEFQGLVYWDHHAENHQGKWRTLFQTVSKSNFDPSTTPLHVEIGCNAGHVIIEWAKRNPNELFIGIDWKFKSIFRAAEKAIKYKLNNVIFLRVHAERLPFIFSQNEITRLCVYFPDPWPKKSQRKNRFLNSARIAGFKSLIHPSGSVHIKTDHHEYFDQILESTNFTEDWDALELSRNLHEKHPDPTSLCIPEVTLFERLFIKDGIPIHSLKLTHKKR